MSEVKSEILSEEVKEAYYNKKMVQDTMSVEEAENIIDDMYQDKYNVIEEKNTIYLDRLDDVKFTNLEFASVRMLREVQKLRRELEKQQKEIEDIYRLNGKLDDENNRLRKEIKEYIEENYISKEAIREYLSSLKEKRTIKDNGEYTFEDLIDFGCGCIKELLGDE